MSEGPVPAILAKQTESGQWASERSYYTPKYVSTHWSMLLLSELLVETNDPGFIRGASFMLDSIEEQLSNRLLDRCFGLGCFYSNVLRYSVAAGKASDHRVNMLVDFAVSDMGEHKCHCPHNHDFPCSWGVARSLWGLAALPPDLRTDEVAAAINSGVRFLFQEYDPVAVTYPMPPEAKVNRMWSRVNFPLFYQADILFALRALDELGMLANTGARQALDWLAQRRQSNGRWRGSSPYRGRTWPDLGDREETDRWVTLLALRILSRAGYDVIQ